MYLEWSLENFPFVSIPFVNMTAMTNSQKASGISYIGSFDFR